jgi:hypothetical protein
MGLGLEVYEWAEPWRGTPTRLPRCIGEIIAHVRMALSGTSDKSTLLLGAPRCRLDDVPDAGDGGPRQKDADAHSNTL